jgi:hypothetical protein
MIEQRWCTVDGRSWTITIGDTKAVVHLMDDERTYAPTIWWSDSSKLIMEISDCIKEAKKACLEVIERTITLDLELNKPKPPVILRGKMYGAEHIEQHKTVKEAADSAYWAIEDNTFMPCEIEHEGEIVWKSFIMTGEIYPSLATLAGIEDSEL